MATNPSVTAIPVAHAIGRGTLIEKLNSCVGFINDEILTRIVAAAQSGARLRDMIQTMSVVAVAYNNSDPGRAALRRGLAEVSRDGRDLVVLHVVEELSVDAREHAERDTREAVAAAGGSAENVLVVVGARGMDPAGALIDQAVQANAELLVVGGRHRSAVGKLLMGSTVQRILLEAPMPVLFVKADDRS